MHLQLELASHGVLLRGTAENMRCEKPALCLWAELLHSVTFFIESILIFVTKLHILNVYHISRIIRRVMSDGNKE